MPTATQHTAPWTRDITRWCRSDRPQVSATSSAKPTPRMDHTLVKVDHLLVVFGGYYFNHHYDDTWFFNTSTRFVASGMSVTVVVAFSVGPAHHAAFFVFVFCFCVLFSAENEGWYHPSSCFWWRFGSTARPASRFAVCLVLEFLPGGNERNVVVARAFRAGHARFRVRVVVCTVYVPPLRRRAIALDARHDVQQHDKKPRFFPGGV